MSAPSAARPLALTSARSWLGSVALATVCAAGTGIALGAAGGSRFLVSRSRGAETSWLLGPLAGAGAPPLDRTGFSLLVLLMAGGYVVAVREAPRIGARAALGGVAALHVVMALAPPLLSPDVFGYLGFARLGAVHGLDPYAHAATWIRADPVYPYVGWKAIPSPYGPLFTLASYPVGRLGVPAGLWTFKALALGAGLGCVALTWSCARQLGREPLGAALFVGLNPLWLVWGVGGAHNDLAATLLTLTGVRAAVGGREGAGAAGLASAAAVKVSAGLALPFFLVGAGRPRRAVLGAGVAGAILVAGASAAFGLDVLPDSLSAVATQAGQRTIYSMPHHVSLLLGYAQVPTGLRVGGLVVLVGVGCATLVAVARHRLDPIAAAGWTTLVLLLVTTWMLPWYVVWLLPLAALGPSRHLRGATLALCAFILATRLPLLLG